MSEKGKIVIECALMNILRFEIDKIFKFDKIIAVLYNKVLAMKRTKTHGIYLMQQSSS